MTIRRLARQHDQRFADAGHLLGVDLQIPMLSVRRGYEVGHVLVVDRDRAGLGEREVASIGPDGV